jgi:hypothetical protein
MREQQSQRRAGDNVLLEVAQNQCAGNLPLFPELFHGLRLSVLPLLPGGPLRSYMPIVHGSSAEAIA